MGMTSLNRQRLCFCFVLLVMFLLTSHTSASDNPLESPAQPALQQKQDAKESEMTKISDDAMKLFLKEMVFYGQIAKPQAVFIIPGTDPRVDGLKIDRHFFSHIFRPVEKSTLRNVRKKQDKVQDHILW